MTKRVAVVGSRDFADMDAVRTFVRELPLGACVVSGGARGVDRVAAQQARRVGIAVVEYLADWDLLGKRAGFVRNATIVENCDEVVAFWDGKSRGTKNTIDLARKLGVPVSIRSPRRSPTPESETTPTERRE